MKRNIFTVIFLLLVSLFLTACENGIQQDPPKENQSPVSIVDENSVTPADIVYSDPTLTDEEKMMMEWNVQVFIENVDIREKNARYNAEIMNSVGIKRVTEFVIEKVNDIGEIEARIVDETDNVYFLILGGGKSKSIYYIANSDGESLFEIRL